MGFTPDAPTEGGITAKPAPGGGYFLGDGPTIILPEETPTVIGPQATLAPTLPPTPTTAPVSSPTPTTPAPTPMPTKRPTPAAEVAGDYEPGSIYGPRLTAKQLQEVKAAVQTALNTRIKDGMSEKQKIMALIDYLCDAAAYADSYKGNANNAYGALLAGKAQCSGYARAFKALCDGAGIGCHYVHAAKDDPVNPSHQWCLIEYGGAWYHIDPQLIDDYIRVVNGKVTYPRPIMLMASHLTYDKKDLPDTAGESITLR